MIAWDDARDWDAKYWSVWIAKALIIKGVMGDRASGKHASSAMWSRIVYRWRIHADIAGGGGTVKDAVDWAQSGGMPRLYERKMILGSLLWPMETFASVVSTTSAS